MIGQDRNKLNKIQRDILQAQLEGKRIIIMAPRRSGWSTMQRILKEIQEKINQGRS